MPSSEPRADQAAGLRRMATMQPVRVIAVSSGKGGVGKTNVSVNLGVAMAQQGQAVMLLDADLGLANVDVLLGLQVKKNLSHVLQGECGLEDVLVTGPGDMHIIPASSGTQHMAELSPAEHAGIIRAFSELTTPVDVLLIDTAAGISDSVVSFCRAAQEIVVVVCDEPTSITDAYAFIKLMNRDYEISRFHVVANMVRSEREGQELFGKLTKVTDRFLDVLLDYMGSLPHDEHVRKAVQRQRAVIDAYPKSPMAIAVDRMARRMLNWPVPSSATGQLEFFVERLIRFRAEAEGVAT